jgi:hypothetical protein
VRRSRGCSWLTAKVLPRASASRRHSSSTASAEESKWRSAEASATASLPDSDRSACASMRQHAVACACINSAGSTSTRSALLAGGVGLVALRDGGDEADRCPWRSPPA